MPRQLEYQIGTSEWVAVGTYAADTREVQWRPPLSGSYRFRSRRTDALGELGPWAYSGRVEVALDAPPPIYGAVAADGCPPAQRGVHGQLWIAPDGRVWRHSALFASPPPDQATITPDGVDGVLWGIDDVTMSGSRATSYARYEVGDERTTTFNLNDDLAESVAGFYMDNVQYYPSTSRAAPPTPQRSGKLAFRLQPGRADFVPAIEDNLFAALRFADGAEALWLYDDPAEPYVSSTVASTRVDERFKGAAVAGVSVRVGRKDKRCPTDPLNPWVPEPSLGVVGLDGRGVEWIHSLASSDAAISAGEIPPNTLAYDAARNAQGVDQGVRIVGGAVSQAAAGGRVWFDEERQTSAANPFDVAMFRVVVGQPARGAVPGDAWGDWQGPVFRRLWGSDGTTYERVSIYRAVTRTASDDTPDTPGNTTSSFDDGFTWSEPRNWSKTVPSGFDVHTQFLFCSTATLDSSATAVEWGDPVLCDDLPDLNAIYKRSAAAPSNPGGADRRTVSREPPAGWHDSTEDVPAGSGAVWVSVGVRQAEASQFEWSDPTKLEGQDGGAGTTYRDVTIYRAVTRTASDDTPDTPGDTTSSFDDGFTWSAPRNWSKTVPSSFDVHDDFLYCSTATLDSSATAVEWGDPVLCDDLPDLNAIYKRSVAKPSNPGGADKRTVSREPPAGWHDSTEDVPAGSGAVWVSVGVRQAEASQFEWSDPTKLEGVDPVELSHNVVEAVADWPYDAGELASTLVTWTRGSRTLDAIRVKVDSRLSSGVPQCRMRLSGIGSSPQVRVDGTVRRGTYAAPWSSNFPCRHEIEVEGVVCTVLVRKGPAPAQTVTVDPSTVALFVRQTGVTYSEEVTWTKAGLTGSASYRTVRFSVQLTTFTSTPIVRRANVRGSLGDLPTAGTQTGGGTVWTTPFTVEGVTVRVHVVVIDVGR